MCVGFILFATLGCGGKEEPRHLKNHCVTNLGGESGFGRVSFEWSHLFSSSRAKMHAMDYMFLDV